MAAPKNTVPEENNRLEKSRHKKQNTIGPAPSSPVVEPKDDSRKLDWVISIVLTFWTIYKFQMYLIYKYTNNRQYCGTRLVLSCELTCLDKPKSTNFIVS